MERGISKRKGVNPPGLTAVCRRARVSGLTQPQIWLKLVYRQQAILFETEKAMKEMCMFLYQITPGYHSEDSIGGYYRFYRHTILV